MILHQDAFTTTAASVRPGTFVEPTSNHCIANEATCLALCEERPLTFHFTPGRSLDPSTRIVRETAIRVTKLSSNQQTVVCTEAMAELLVSQPVCLSYLSSLVHVGSAASAKSEYNRIVDSRCVVS
jgi:hypothetical protein